MDNEMATSNQVTRHPTPYGRTYLEQPPSSLQSPGNKRKHSEPSDEPNKRACGSLESRPSASSSLSSDTNHSDSKDPNIYEIIGRHRLEGYIEPLPWGLQWEIARAHQLGRISLDQFEVAVIKEFRGLNTSEGIEKLRRLASSGTPDLSNLSEHERNMKEPWKELDEESSSRKAISPSEITDPPSLERYHGMVHFTARLIFTSLGNLQLALDYPELGNSTRFARQFGSESIIRINISPKQVTNYTASRLKLFLKSNFVLFGRTFQAYSLKDDTVFLMWVGSKAYPPIQHRPSLFHVLNWHNPVHLNQDQAAAKWAARFQLGHSTTVPALYVGSARVHNNLGDFDGQTRTLVQTKLEANHCMTDGCGYANVALLRAVQRLFKWSTFPTAIQFRYGGAKGLVLLHPDGRYRDTDASPTLWFRPSQLKIHYQDENMTPTQRMFEVVCSTRLTTPARLAPQTLINLRHNGVSAKIFAKINLASMQEMFRELTAWSDPFAMQRLYYNIERIGGVPSMRAERAITESSRAWGFKEKKDVDPSSAEDDAIDESSRAWFPDPVSGCPSTLHETALKLLAAGFHPSTCPVLAAKLGEVLKSQLRIAAENYRISIDRSAVIHCAPVPTEYRHLLKEDEVHLLSSSENLLQNDGQLSRTISGSALVTRYPCMLPSDFQKVTVVARPELSKYTDILLMPIEAHRSLASLLGGGDYDGGAFQEPWITKILTNNRYHFDPPAGFEDNFEQKTITIKDMLKSYPDFSDLEQQQALAEDLQNVILDGLSGQNLISRYSEWHAKAVDRKGYGYDHPETIRLAYMFCAVLDAAKSGKRVRKDVLAKDSKDWDILDRPEWTKPVESKVSSAGRSKTLDGGFTPAMAYIRRESLKKRQELLEQYTEMTQSRTKDQDLCAPWEKDVKRVDTIPDQEGAASLRRELEAIRLHLETQYKNRKTNQTAFTSRPIRDRQDMLRAESRAFASGPAGIIYHSEKDVIELKASYAYILDSSKSTNGWSRWRGM